MDPLGDVRQRDDDLVGRGCLACVWHLRRRYSVPAAPNARETPVNTALRDGLVDVPGGLPTFASAGLEARAALIGRIAADSHAYVSLGF
jgi:hypothetical protein